MSASLIRSLLVVTESGLNIYEHHHEPSELNSSQLVSGMYTAFFTFFETEMSKGQVRSIELSETKMIIFSHIDLNCIIEFERYCEESAISILTEAVKSLVETILPERQLNPNRYLQQIENSTITTIFKPKWQQKYLKSEKMTNLLNSIAIGKVIDDNITLIHVPEILGLEIGSTWNKSDDYFYIDLTIENTKDYTIISSLPHKNRILSHVRLITEFLTIVQPEGRFNTPYYVPFFSKSSSDLDIHQLVVIYGWVLPELIETILLKGRLVIIGDDTSTNAIHQVFESLGISEMYKISPFFTKQSDLDNIDTYSIIRTNLQVELMIPQVNLYNNKRRGLSNKGYIRKEMDGTQPDQLIQKMQELFVRLEKIHHDLFNFVFQIDQNRASRLIRQYKQNIPGHIWELALPFFALKTPFLIDNLESVLNRRRLITYNRVNFSTQNVIKVDYDQKHDRSEIMENIIQSVVVNTAPIILILFGAYVLMKIIS